MRSATGLIAPLLATLAVIPISPTHAGPRLDQVQILGTHNSYHVAPHPSLETLIRSRHPDQADALAYTHRPLRDQLDRLGVRQFELDLYADPDGGLFATPAGVRLALDRGLPPVPSPDPEVMRRPGTKVLHVPDFDFQTTVPSLAHALRELLAWSLEHPDHVPLCLLLELKEAPAGPEFTQPLPWTDERLDALEHEILDILPASRLVRPDEVRRGHRTLREAVLAQGWPALADLRGRFLLALDNTDAIRDRYLRRSPNLADRLFFVSVDETHPAAAWFKINDPVADGERIRRLVRQGFLVRTRADADTLEARLQDASRRDAALASGAQWISTDYPEPQPSWGTYTGRWPGTAVARLDPAGGPGLSLPPDADLEDLAIRGGEPYAPRELEHLSSRAFRLHLQRRLKEASADYARLLELDPPHPPTPEQHRLILDLAPQLRTVEGDPFPLRDVVALHHPTHPLIAYHLFWADDIDFPEDNDPVDHEVVWISYVPGSVRAQQILTYFHGTILAADAFGDRPQVAVEWGKHGSIPMGPNGPSVEPPALRRHWNQLHDRGIRLPDHPLARDWPKRFDGDWNAYRAFRRTVDARSHLERRGLIWIGARANAILDQHALPYNFAPKTEWPDSVVGRR